MVYLIKTTGQRDFTDFIFIIIKVNVFASLKKKLLQSYHVLWHRNCPMQILIQYYYTLL